MRALILAGGRASRLGGTDKTLLPYRGRTLLEHALAATADHERIVVGAASPGTRAVTEEPRWAGPVAAIAAGLAALPDEGDGLVAVLAADQPRVAEALPLVQNAARGPGEAWIPVDPDGNRQPLLGVYREAALRRALAELGDPAGASVHRLLARLAIVEVPLPADLTGDVDTPEDADRFGIPLAPERTLAVTDPSELDAWAAELSAALGLDLPVDVALVLDLARDAAHGVARPAAPLTTFLVGYAAALRGGTAEQIQEAAAIASRLASTRG